MKKIIVLIIGLLISVLSVAQELTIAVEGGLTDMTADTSNPDLDAKTFYPKTDDNDVLCALIKVTLTNSLAHPLVLDVGGVGVVDREVRENGEIWFWIPVTVLNLKFSCMGYNEIPKIPVTKLESGHVYRLKFRNDAVIETIVNVGITSNFLKIKVVPQDAAISVGKNSSDLNICNAEMLTDGVFSRRLDIGRYYYKIEHEMYETQEGFIDLTAETKDHVFALVPAYGFLNIKTLPSGADVFLDGQRIGTSPISKYGPVKRGTCRIRVQKHDYHSNEQAVTVIGDGQTQVVSMNLDAQFATVTCVCDDPMADLYVNDEYKAKGTWTGNLSSTVTHTLESRRQGHRSQKISFHVSDGEVVTKRIAAPVPLYGTLVVQTTPDGCKVVVDGKEVGKAPIVHQLLVGNHKVALSHDEYLSETHEVIIKHNEETSLQESLVKGRLKAKVVLKTSSSTAAIYKNGIFLAYKSWSGTLEEGEYLFTTRDTDCNDGVLKYTLKGSSPVNLTIPAPVKKTGTVTFKANKVGADIQVTTPSGESLSYRSPANNQRLPIGTYTASASKTGYYSSGIKTFSVRDNQLTNVDFDLKKKRWIMQKEDFSSSFLDVNYGYGVNLSQNNHSSQNFIGLDYTYLKRHIGLHTSAMYGLDYGEFGFHAGPIFRLTDDYNAVDFQLYAGAGVMSSPSQSLKFSGDAGLRMSFDQDHSWSWFSLSMGCMFTNDLVVPNIGTSMLLPASLSYLAENEEYNFASHFLDFMFGYDVDNDDVMLGANYAWCKTHLGLYGSFLVGLDGGLSISAGPVLRLTTDYSACDLQLYGGPGYMNGYFGGDIGLRFGWHSDPFSWWDFTLGCQMYNGCFIPTVGVGFGISLTVVAAGLAVIGAMFAV